MLAAAPAAAGVITKTNSTDGFADFSHITRGVNFLAGDFGGDPTTVADVDVTIYFAKSGADGFLAEGDPLPGDPPFFNEIEFAIQSPAGTWFTLIANNGLTEHVPLDNFETFAFVAAGPFRGTIVFDQSAAQPVDFNPLVIPSGTYRPDDHTANSLDIFNGEDAVGTWMLFIEDDTGLDGLSFYEFSVTITTAVAPVPEPGTLALFGVGAAGLALLCHRRRRRAAARDRLA